VSELADGQNAEAKPLDQNIITSQTLKSAR